MPCMTKAALKGYTAGVLKKDADAWRGRGIKAGKKFLQRYFAQESMRFTCSLGQELSISMAKTFCDKCLHFYTIWFLHDLDPEFEFLDQHVDEWTFPDYLEAELLKHDRADPEIQSRLAKLVEFRPKNLM